MNGSGFSEMCDKHNLSRTGGPLSHLMEAQVVFDGRGGVKHHSFRRHHQHKAVQRLHREHKNMV